MKTPAELIKFAADRLVYVYGDREGQDFILDLRALAATIPEPAPLHRRQERTRERMTEEGWETFIVGWECKVDGQPWPCDTVVRERVKNDELRAIVERTARMGLCSQTHEHLMLAAGTLLRTPTPEPASGEGQLSGLGPATERVWQLATRLDAMLDELVEAGWSGEFDARERAALEKLGWTRVLGEA